MTRTLKRKSKIKVLHFCFKIVFDFAFITLCNIIKEIWKYNRFYTFLDSFWSLLSKHFLSESNFCIVYKRLINNFKHIYYSTFNAMLNFEHIYYSTFNAMLNFSSEI